MTDSPGRIFGLDVLRALAVLFVVYGHGYNYVDGGIPVTLYLLPSLDGVTVFFVLSGFLIGRILLRTVAKHDFNGPMLVQFWIRRWFRTLPNYFLVLSFLVVAYSLLDRPEPDDLWRYFLFSQNIAWPHPQFFVEA
jgi:peptidoglycan/LPS O-acetylase OafA/YrhL